MTLNPEQQRAVSHVEGPALVLAGAGSGKTRVITHRIASLIERGVPASTILAVTFTNKAAQEMRERIEKISSQFVLTSTFHSLCARILRESIIFLGYDPAFTIYDEDDSEKLLKECLATLNIKPEKGFVKTVRAQISRAKNMLIDPEKLQSLEPDIAPIYALYQERLQSYGALDFDDLLFLTLRLFKEHYEVLEKYQNRWHYILIDEYQDTNHAQHMLIKLLALKHHNIFAVGDPDQSIYSWRGALVTHILHFEDDFPGALIVPLEQNYRSSLSILKTANALIRHNPSRHSKNLWSTLGDGEQVEFFTASDEGSEARFVMEKLQRYHAHERNSSAILYRTNFQSRVFEDALLRHKIPYIIVGGLSFYERREVKDILSFLRLLISDRDFLSFARTVNLPKRGFGEAAVEKVQQFMEERALPIMQALQLCLQKGEIRLSAKQIGGLRTYFDQIAALREMIKANVPLSQVLTETIKRFSYLEHLREDPETYDDRKENILELIAKASEWERLNKSNDLVLFLEELSLNTTTEEREEGEEAVKLMTLHHAKGLEFDVVFLVGLEEDILPHANCKANAEAIEEERRLCYVGITRARKKLYLTHARLRFLWGEARFMMPSRFLKELAVSA